MRDSIAAADARWFVVCLLAEIVAFGAYALVLRDAVERGGGPRLGYGLSLHVTFASLGATRVIAAAGAGGRRGLFLGWLAGMTLELAGFVWILYAIRSFSGLGAVVSSLLFAVWLLYTSIPWAALGWALGRLRRVEQIYWVIPLWVGLEHFFPRLFPWHVGGALYDSPWLLQCADLLGASGLTAFVFLVSAALYHLLFALFRRATAPVARPSGSAAQRPPGVAVIRGSGGTGPRRARIVPAPGHRSR